MANAMKVLEDRWNALNGKKNMFERALREVTEELIEMNKVMALAKVVDRLPGLKVTIELEDAIDADDTCTTTLPE